MVQSLFENWIARLIRLGAAQRRQSGRSTGFALDYSRDPLSQPEIAKMSERERADLPFDPYRIKPD